MRIDMTSREWAELVRPVLPHALKDPEMPQLGHVRIELGTRSLYAIASDRYTMGIERHVLAGADQHQAQPGVHLDHADVTASLKMFTYSRDSGPPLSVTIDTIPYKTDVIGGDGSWSSLGITLESDSARIVMHDRRMGDRDQLSGWREALSGVLRREQAALLDGIALSAPYLARWKDAVRAGEVARFYTGPRPGSPLLVTVERHFAGLWMPAAGIDAQSVAGLPWLGELGVPDEPDVDGETGEKL